MIFTLLVLLGLAGRGAIIKLDCGYDGWRTDPVSGKQVKVHTPLPTRCVFIGITDKELGAACDPPGPYLVFAKNGLLKGGSVLLRPWEVPWRGVMSRGVFPVSEVSIEDVEVSIRK